MPPTQDVLAQQVDVEYLQRPKVKRKLQPWNRKLMVTAIPVAERIMPPSCGLRVPNKDADTRSSSATLPLATEFNTNAALAT